MKIAFKDLDNKAKQFVPLSHPMNPLTRSLCSVKLLFNDRHLKGRATTLMEFCLDHQIRTTAMTKLKLNFHKIY